MEAAAQPTNSGEQGAQSWLWSRMSSSRGSPRKDTRRVSKESEAALAVDIAHQKYEAVHDGMVLKEVAVHRDKSK